MTRCPQCGMAVDAGQRFCGGCGSRLEQTTGPADERNAVLHRPGGGRPDPFEVGGSDDAADDFFSQFIPKSSMPDDAPLPSRRSRRRFNPSLYPTGEVPSGMPDDAPQAPSPAGDARAAAPGAGPGAGAGDAAGRDAADAGFRPASPWTERPAEPADAPAPADAAEPSDAGLAFAPDEPADASAWFDDAPPTEAMSTEEVREALDERAEAGAYGAAAPKWFDNEADAPTAAMSSEEVREALGDRGAGWALPGLAQPGPAQPGPQPGPVQPGPVQRGPVQRGPVPAGPGQPGYGQPGSGQPGSGQAGPAQAGPGQPGPAQPAAFEPPAFQPPAPPHPAAPAQPAGLAHPAAPAPVGGPASADDDVAMPDWFTELTADDEPEAPAAPFAPAAERGAAEPWAAEEPTFEQPTFEPPAAEQPDAEQRAADFWGAPAAEHDEHRAPASPQGSAFSAPPPGPQAPSGDGDASFTQLIRGLQDDPADRPLQAPPIDPTGIVPLPPLDEPAVDDDVRAAQDRAAAFWGAPAAARDESAAEESAAASVEPPESDFAPPVDFSAQHAAEFGDGRPSFADSAEVVEPPVGTVDNPASAPEGEQRSAEQAAAEFADGWFVEDDRSAAAEPEAHSPQFGAPGAEAEQWLQQPSHRPAGMPSLPPLRRSRAVRPPLVPALRSAPPPALGSARRPATERLGSADGPRGPGDPGGPSGTGGTGGPREPDETEQRRRGVRTIAIAAAAAVVVIAAAFGLSALLGQRGDDAPIAGGDPTSSAEPTGDDQPTGSDAAPPPITGEVTPAPEAFEPVAFMSSSGNLRCQITPEHGAVCQIMERGFTLPEGECYGSGYSGAAVGVNRDGTYWPCPTGDLSGGEVVDYDVPVTAGEYTCSISYDTGATCANAEGDSFTIEYSAGIELNGTAATVDEPDVEPVG